MSFFPHLVLHLHLLNSLDVLPQLADKHTDICSNLKACKLINTVNKQIHRTLTEGERKQQTENQNPEGPRGSARLCILESWRDRTHLPLILVTVSCNSRCKATTDTGHLCCSYFRRGREIIQPCLEVARSRKVRLSKSPGSCCSRSLSSLAGWMPTVHCWSRPRLYRPRSGPQWHEASAGYPRWEPDGHPLHREEKIISRIKVQRDLHTTSRHIVQGAVQDMAVTVLMRTKPEIQRYKHVPTKQAWIITHYPAQSWNTSVELKTLKN